MDLSSKEKIILFLELFQRVKIELSAISFYKVPSYKRVNGWLTIDPEGPITYSVSAESHETKLLTDLNEAVEYFLHLHNK